MIIKVVLTVELVFSTELAGETVWSLAVEAS